MTGVLTVIGRFVIILLGYTAASLAASFFINVVFLACLLYTSRCV